MNMKLNYGIRLPNISVMFRPPNMVPTGCAELLMSDGHTILGATLTIEEVEHLMGVFSKEIQRLEPHRRLASPNAAA